MRLFAKIPTVMAFVIAAGGMFLPACSCGDDGGDPDARPTFDAPPTPDADDTDAEVPDADIADLRSGTVAISQVTVTNDLTALGISDGAISGAGVSVSYVDLTTATVAPTVGSNGIGECTVWVYDVGTSQPPAEVDEGAVTISGTGITPSSFPACAFLPDPVNEYKCIAGNGSLPDGATVTHSIEGATPNKRVQTLLTVPGVDFAALNAFGMVVNVSGFTTASGINNGTFMIVTTRNENSLLPANTVVIVNFKVNAAIGNPEDAGAPATAAALSETYVEANGSATDSYAVIAGTTPIIGPFTFISDYAQDITIAKAAGSVVPAFSVTLQASGDTVALGDNSALPHALTVAATSNVDNVFTCAAADNGNCGTARNDSSASQIVGWTISGSTSDGSLTTGCDGNPCLPIQMPDPETQWAEFVCKGSPGSDSITLTAAALDAIMATSPTRIQTRLLRVTADITSAEVTSLVAGKGFVGFYTVPPPP